MKLTAAGLKEIKGQGKAAALAVDAMVNWMGKRTSGRNLEYTSRVILDEGARYQMFSPDGRELALTMVSESTIGAAKQHGGANYQIGKEVAIPVGAWVVENQLFLGQKFSRLYHNNGQQKLNG